MPTRLQIVPKKTFGMHQRYSPWRKGMSFTPTEDAKARWKTTWIKSSRNLFFLLIIMIKINNECVSKCLRHCLEQRKWKYDRALDHSDNLIKHTVLAMWKILQMKNNNNNNNKQKQKSFSVKSSVSPFSLILLFWTQFCAAATCLVVTVLDSTPLLPKIQECQNSCFHS